MVKLNLFFIEHKKSIITISILGILLLSMQTSLSFKNNKIKELQKEIEILKTKKSNESSKNAMYSSEEKEEYNEHFFYSRNNTLEDAIMKDTKEKYISFAKSFNKIYDENLVGNEVYKFECMNLQAITEGQVKGGISRLTKKNFNIKIEQSLIGDTVFYKIKLYE